MITHDAIPFDDRGLLLGEGLFETLLALDGELRHLDAHLDRMAAGCVVLGMPFDRAEAEGLCRSMVPPSGRMAVRLTLTGGSGGRGLDRPADLKPRLFARVAAVAPVTTPARVILSSVRRNEGSPASRLKTLAYVDSVLARTEAVAAGADEALMLNNRGDLVCGAAANVFWVEGGRLFTPALDCGVLPGVTRARLLAAQVVEEVAVGPQVLDRAEAVFLTNSLIGVRPVSRLGERAFEPHPLVERLRSALPA